ncbi:MAG: hypothetical protein C5B53_11895 [Candidatus Melainabacteria bacterium]|nr:MAG: hypothetical protein C5B53_11895 [Candidatus Melainabacteria bacterium]
MINELINRTKFKHIRKRKCLVRNRQGSVLSEAGPALFILFICAVFPVIDIIFIGLSYCACSTLNSLQLREVARLPSSQAMAGAQSVEQRWKSSGLGYLAVSNTDPTVSITYNNGEDTTIGTDVYVNVATTFTVRPLLTIPFLPGVPGLGAPMQWTVRGQRLMENPHYAAQ